MKITVFSFAFFLFAFSCKKNNNAIPNPSIIGKWKPTNELQILQPDGTWSDWTPSSPFKSLPAYEFTKKGRFLLDDKITETCCNPGSLYKLSNDTLTFTYDKAPECRNVKCADANTKIIVQLVENELILIESSGRYKLKYKRIN